LIAFGMRTVALFMCLIYTYSAIDTETPSGGGGRTTSPVLPFSVFVGCFGASRLTA
jgi:hypothetical protein